VIEVSKRMAKERFVAREADFCGNPNEITAQVLDSVQLFSETIIPAVDEALVQ
jgi:hypothetical protein